MVPQETTVFRGTWRFNLDPMGEFEDEQVNLAVRLTRFSNWLAKHAPRGLDEPVPEGAALGQELKALLGIGRALLRLLQRRSKLLVMDGATCALDSASDATLTALLLRYCRRREVAMLQTSRRTNQVALYDTVAVLQGGRLMEHGPAKKLWAKDGALRALARAQGVDSAALTKADAVTDRLTSVWSWDVSPQEDPAWSDEFSVSLRKMKDKHAKKKD
uniref:ABC transporter domain-containing protein n=1 Tax=Zooxanthella nutricula TaxID=1333877 RepID=A0A7S2QK04_9DINO